ncbi:hypothetical protein DPA88_21450 [Salmonella enterica subsp. salamae]|uniref:Uncharacterized protein n=1 Tax=Salmonella enterica subsp. salamae TaxID=59202 RepID=A0A5Y1W945_SALER|nr:hypothetical protein [Salmonella enterica subsp. enterica serovar Newport]ECC1604491.1 hypothetical protein [Salmonella enterica subsp. salamae]ECL1759088.1 hypothetical protein [Salmonella enterica]ECD9354073.1 hypothetical protein [Salmonella enterica subsp. salamae]ECI4312953.1 hypothetical protein [Salmonella enterica subsp. salamae]
MSVLLSVKFNESKGGMMVDIRVNGNGRETPEELNRAMAMAKAASAVMKEMHNGETLKKTSNDERIREVMARGYRDCD